MEMEMHRGVDGIMRCNYSTPASGAVQYGKADYEMFSILLAPT